MTEKQNDKYFYTYDKEKIWQRFCGFLELSLNEFMEIQERLLLEQIELVSDSPLGKVIMKCQQPASVEEFRTVVPLTTYDDYIQYIGNSRENCLAEKPHYWVHTSYTKGAFKHVPWTERFVQTQLRNVIASLILSSATQKWDVKLAPGCRILAILPERPFVSAQLAFGIVEQFSANPVLPLEVCEKLPFSRKIDTLLKRSLYTNMDYMILMTSSFLPLERGFHRMIKNTKMLSILPKIHPLISWRLIRNNLKRLVKSNESILPKHLWGVKGIVAWGSDSEALQDTVCEQWGKPLFQFYGSSESGLMAMQDWRKDNMTFLHDGVFLEFIPEDQIEHKEGISTLLINELEEGKLYEPVITSFYGMPFLRYRQGDLIKIVSTPNDQNGNRLPKLTFHSRADDLIDLFGIARINTKVASEALELTGIPHGEWTIRKEHETGKPVLRIYIELDNETQATDLAHRFHRKLKSVDRHYGEATYTMAYNPIRVTPLVKGAFERYLRESGRDGHDQDLQTLPHMNLTDSIIKDLTKKG